MSVSPRLAALVIAPVIAAALLAACNDSTTPAGTGAGGGGADAGGGGGGGRGDGGAGGASSGSGGAAAGGAAGAGTDGGAGAGGSGGGGSGAGGAGPGPDAGSPPPDCPWRSTWVTTTVATPFAAPNATLTFAPPSIPCVLFPITSYGATAGGTASSTAAFRLAMAAATAAGGGVVVVPSGRWLTGAVTLGSNVELHLAAGATVAFSQTTADYLPAVLTRWEGLDVTNWSPFVYARDAHDVALTASGAGATAGTLDGQGSSWWGWKLTGAAENQRVYDYYVARLQANGTLPSPLPAPPASAVAGGLRPSLVECNGCTNFLIDGVRTQNAPYWTLHPLYSTNVVIRNATITSNAQGTNGDGVDVDSCRNVLIERTSFDTSDDIISIKSGLNEDGIAVARPSERIVIRDITATAGHALSLGSEMSGGINDVWVTSSGGAGARNTLAGMQHLLRIKTLPGRGGVVQNVWYENVAGSDWGTYAVELTTRYMASTIAPHNPALLPALRNVTVRNVSGTSASRPSLNLAGLTQAPFQGVLFDGVTLSGAGPNGCATVASGVSVTASTISGVTGATIACP